MDESLIEFYSNEITKEENKYLNYIDIIKKNYYYQLSDCEANVEIAESILKRYQNTESGEFIKSVLRKKFTKDTKNIYSKFF